jgi:putative transposase
MIQQDAHLLTVLRYVERNPLRAGAVSRAEDWRWSSLHVRLHGPKEMRQLLSDWPIERPRNWTALVNEPQTQAEENAIQTATKRGRPLGSASWVQTTAERHNLQTTLRPRGRQKGWRKRKAG